MISLMIISNGIGRMPGKVFIQKTGRRKIIKYKRIKIKKNKKV